MMPTHYHALMTHLIIYLVAAGFRHSTYVQGTGKWNVRVVIDIKPLTSLFNIPFTCCPLPLLRHLGVYEVVVLLDVQTL
jgi:hypothetical protein